MLADPAAPLPEIVEIDAQLPAVFRSSWWLHDRRDWRVRFHQGTPAA